MALWLLKFVQWVFILNALGGHTTCLNGTSWVMRQLREQVFVIWHLGIPHRFKVAQEDQPKSRIGHHSQIFIVPTIRTTSTCWLSWDLVQFVEHWTWPGRSSRDLTKGYSSISTTSEISETLLQFQFIYDTPTCWEAWNLMTLNHFILIHDPSFWHLFTLKCWSWMEQSPIVSHNFPCQPFLHPGSTKSQNQPPKCPKTAEDSFSDRPCWSACNDHLGETWYRSDPQ